MDQLQLIQCESKKLTALHIAAAYGKKELVAQLIEEGADVNAQGDEGHTPLHYACHHAHKLIAQLLIDAGAEVNLMDSKGWSALYFALARKENADKISQRFWDMVNLLLNSGADPYKKTKSGKSCFDRVKNDEQRLRIRLIHIDNKLKSCDDRVSTIDKYLRIKDFFELVKKGDYEIETIEKFLTPRFVKSRLESFDNITPLHRAAGYNHLRTAKLLIDHGADVNARDDHNQIPLHNAARYGHVEMIELLIGENCIINTQDVYGMSPLHVAATSNDFVACLRLVNLGADITVRTPDGKLPIDFAETDVVRNALKIYDTPEGLMTSSQAHLGQPIYMYQDENINTPNASSQTWPFDELMLDSKSDEPLFGNRTATGKIYPLDRSAYEFKLIEERMHSTIKHHDGIVYKRYEIIAIEQNLHKDLWKKYRNTCENLEIDSNLPRAERLLFHGSPYVDIIQRKGFDQRYAKRGGMFGAGIYFTDISSKSNQYTFHLDKGCEKHGSKSCYVCERKLVYAQVNLGRSLVTKEEIPLLSQFPPGYDSVTGKPGVTKGLNYPEYVIYNGGQAYPLYVITYRIKP